MGVLRLKKNKNKQIRNPIHTRVFWAKFGWNWPSGFGEEDL